MRFLFVLCAVCGTVFPSFAVDREAFTFVRYDLNLTIDPGQQRLGVRGKIILRNDSDSPQKNIVLQISSTLHWASIQIGGKAAEYVTQTYNSDIDHTGALSEVIVTLSRSLAPKQTVEIEVGYEGVIAQDATRLTRIGVPAEIAKHSEWDQISAAFTVVRGIGYVAWYPIATEAANMSDASSGSEAVGRWKQRENLAQMMLSFDFVTVGPSARLFCRGTQKSQSSSRDANMNVQCSSGILGNDVPFFALANEEVTESSHALVFYLPENKSGADNYVLALNQVAPVVAKWFGEHATPPSANACVIEIPDGAASPFQSGNTLLTPLADDDTGMLLSVVQLLTHVTFPSSRPWISEGLASYAAARYVEQEKGRETAINYLQSHRGALVETEKQNTEAGKDHAAEHSLINATDDFYVRTKAMNVWWMLRDLVGEAAFTAALHNYKADEDKDALYVQKLVEAQSHRDLTWFFDDWVYRDRGLPDLRIDSVYLRPVVSGGYLLTVTVENLGGAAAEVPVTVQMVTGSATEKLLVPGKSKASVRILAASAPMKATVNDGGVPESDTTNNTYTIESLNH